MYDYSPLWETLKEKEISTYSLIKWHNISKGTIDQLKHNRNVTIQTLDTLCQITRSPIEKIVRVTMDPPREETLICQEKPADSEDTPGLEDDI